MDEIVGNNVTDVIPSLNAHCTPEVAHVVAASFWKQPYVPSSGIAGWTIDRPYSSIVKRPLKVSTLRDLEAPLSLSSAAAEAPSDETSAREEDG